MLHAFTVSFILPTPARSRVFIVAVIISLTHHQRYIISETDSVVRRSTERRILGTVLHVSLHINLIQDCHGKSDV